MDSLNNCELLHGLIITPLKQIFDDRGGVFHVLKKTDFGYHGFGEVYISMVREGSIKAWKYHKELTQNFCVPYGKLKLVLYDDRDTSPTKGVINTLILDDNSNYNRVTIPPMIWYGFQCLNSEHCILLNVANNEHDPNESISLPYNINKIPYIW